MCGSGKLSGTIALLGSRKSIQSLILPSCFSMTNRRHHSDALIRSVMSQHSKRCSSYTCGRNVRRRRSFDATGWIPAHVLIPWTKPFARPSSFVKREPNVCWSGGGSCVNGLIGHVTATSAFHTALVWKHWSWDPSMCNFNALIPYKPMREQPCLTT